jgi:flagellar motor switch protein FliM
MRADLQIAGSGKSPGAEAAPYELFVTGQLARESVECMDRIHKLFLRAAEAELSELLQLPVKMTGRETEQSTFLNSRDGSQGDRLSALSLAPVSGCAFLSFSPALLFGVLDILLATPSPQSDHSGRIVTSIEVHVLREFFDLIVRSLSDTWKQFYPAAFRQVPASEEELERRLAAAGNDPAVILNASVEMNGASAGFRLILPTCLARMAELEIKSAAAPRAEPETIDSTIIERLSDAKLDIQAVLQGSGIRIRDLLDLTPGKILLLGSSAGTSFDCLVNGSPQFSGNLVSEEGRCGIRLREFSPDPAGT